MNNLTENGSAFWSIKDAEILQLITIGINPVKFVDFSMVKPLDKITEENFWDFCFMSGRPMRFSGKISIPFLPPGFEWNLFQNVGLLASPEIADTFRELAGHQVQLFPVAYQDAPDRFYYINMVQIFDCVDFERSEATYNDDGKPDSIQEMVLRDNAIDPNAVIFTTTFLTGTVIIRDSLRKELLKRHEIKGSKFVPLQAF